MLYYRYLWHLHQLEKNLCGQSKWTEQYATGHLDINTSYHVLSKTSSIHICFHFNTIHNSSWGGRQWTTSPPASGQGDLNIQCHLSKDWSVSFECVLTNVGFWVLTIYYLSEVPNSKLQYWCSHWERQHVCVQYERQHINREEMTCCFADASFSSFAWVIFSTCIWLWSNQTQQFYLCLHIISKELIKLDKSHHKDENN